MRRASAFLCAAFALGLSAAAARAQTQPAGTANPHGNFDAPCAQCHLPDAWRPTKISSEFKHAPNLFPLQGAHARVTCVTCHKRLDFTGVPTTCASCHRDAHQGELGANCATCHSARSFTDMAQMRQAHQVTAFPLTGLHAAVDCRSCHAPRAPGQQAFVNLPTACESCHLPDYQKAVNPPHASAGFPKDCSSCHSPSGWRGAPFDHSRTLFPLTGAHRAANCVSCHADKVYRGKPTTCVSCHQADYNKTKEPAHAASGFPTTCETCHNTTAWEGAPFDHSKTLFPLTGAHKAANCATCHADGVYKGKPTACVSCHQSDYDKSDPPHKAAGFPTTCESCHSTAAWAGAVFDHGTTQFPLTGAHKAVNCAGCHSDGVYKGKATTCVSCHQTTYNQTKNPPHAASGFSTTCETCHNTTQWPGAVFDHSKTIFPLTGAHAAVTCQNCHSDGVYVGKSTACVSCHLAKYNQTTTPPHASSGFPTTCETCHNTTAWPGATFNHSATQFPLTGAHTTVSCQGCHADGVYKGKSTACSSCHLAAYNATTDPNHKAAAFPTDCASCHTTTSWAGATFNHDAQWFPIYSGHHAGVWSSCATCHTNPTNFAVFDCLSCHTKTKTDQEHQGRSGYVYASPNCYACHPRGSSG